MEEGLLGKGRSIHNTISGRVQECPPSPKIKSLNKTYRTNFIIYKQSKAIQTTSIIFCKLNLTVKAVVNAVNNVFSSRFLGSESALVLLDNILLCRGKSWDTVYISYRLVWAV